MGLEDTLQMAMTRVPVELGDVRAVLEMWRSTAPTLPQELRRWVRENGAMDPEGKQIAERFRKGCERDLTLSNMVELDAESVVLDFIEQQLAPVRDQIRRKGGVSLVDLRLGHLLDNSNLRAALPGILDAPAQERVIASAISRIIDDVIHSLGIVEEWDHQGIDVAEQQMKLTPIIFERVTGMDYESLTKA
jgi:hypothetical protein